MTIRDQITAARARLLEAGIDASQASYDPSFADSLPDFPFAARQRRPDHKSFSAGLLFR